MSVGSKTRLNLPLQLTSFIGRENEIAEIVALMRHPDCRLLTLIGPGGSGKTRLAVELARRADLSHGAYFVPLQPLHSADDIIGTIVDVLPLQAHGSPDLQGQLLDYLRERQMLIILDNFEHLLDGVGIISDILNAAPHVKLLVTSREALHLQAEYLWPLQGLDTPPDDGVEDFDEYSAVQLFIERARRVKPDFSPQRHKHELGHICRLVGGLPLALELAASWTRTLNPQAIGDEIHRSIDFLSTKQHDIPERHRSMRAVLDHSWHLLSEGEQALFGKLSVFRGGFTIDAAWHVAGGTLHTLASLIDKSLVRTNEHGRYDLQELLRQYANEKLEATGTDKSTHDNHSAYYAAFLHERVDDLKGRRQIEAIVEIDADFENIRSAWIWAADHRLTDVLEQMVDGLWIYCWIKGRAQENAALFQYAETRYLHHQGESERRIWGRLLSHSNYGNNSQPDLNPALEIAREYNDPAEIAFCLESSGHKAYTNQEIDTALQLFEQSLSLYRQIGDAYGTARVFMTRTTRDYRTSWEEKKVLADELLRLQREIGDRTGTGWTLGMVATHEGRLGHFAEAERLWMECVTFGQEVGNPDLVANSYAHISHRVYFWQGNFAQAHETANEAIKLGTTIGSVLAIAWALPALGLLASMNEDYSEGKRLCLEAVSISNVFADIGKLAAWGLALASCGLQDYEAARTHLSGAFPYLTSIQGLVGEIAILPIAAILCAHEGQPVRAVELLALAYSHPLGVDSWMKKWPLLDRFQAELEQTLGANEFSVAWQRGKQMSLPDVIIELRAQLSGPDKVATKPVRQSLPHPLSERELEVLALIADGLTNREIAAHLFVGVSTVRKHIQHINTKLDTDNRTRAVNRARKLNLLQ